MIKFVALSEICIEIVDCPHESPQWLKEGIPIIRNFNLIDGRIDLSDDYYVDEETYNRRIRRAIPSEGDIIFSREAPIGNCAIIPSGLKCCLGQRLVLLRVNKEICSAEYLLTVLLSDYVKKQIEQISRRGSIVSNFNISELRKLSIPIIDNQEEISEFATLLNKKITTNKIINNELESMTKTIYDYWFLQFDFPDENGKLYKSSGGKMVWNEELKREIPEGWEVIKLEKLCSFSNGINYEKNKEWDKVYKIINVRNITATSLLLDAGEFDEINLLSSQAEKYIVEPYDILIARSGTPGAIRLLYSSDENIIYCGFIIKCSPNEKEHRLFLTYALKKLEGSNATKTGGSIMQNVSQETLKQIDICLPTDQLIDQYNKVVMPLINKMQEIIRENQELISLRDFLLPLLMNGQVGLKQ